MVQSICGEHDSQCDSAAFDSAVEYVEKVIDSNFFEEYLRSEARAKHLLDVLTSGN